MPVFQFNTVRLLKLTSWCTFLADLVNLSSIYVRKRLISNIENVNNEKWGLEVHVYVRMYVCMCSGQKKTLDVTPQAPPILYFETRPETCQVGWAGPSVSTQDLPLYLPTVCI